MQARGWRLPLLITFLVVNLFLSCFATPVDIVGSEAEEIAVVQSASTDLLAETEKIVEGTNNLEQAEIHSELSWTTEIIDIDEEELETILARASRTDYHVVEVYARWCPFSEQFEPVMRRIAEAFPELPVFAVDASIYYSFARKHSVHSYPKIAIFKGGDLHSQYEGSRSFDDLCDFITKHTGIAPVSLARENEGEDHKPDEMNVVDSENSDPLRNSKFEPAFDYVLLLASSYLVLLVGNRLCRFLSSQRTDVVEHEKQE